MGLSEATEGKELLICSQNLVSGDQARLLCSPGCKCEVNANAIRDVKPARKRKKKSDHRSGRKSEKELTGRRRFRENQRVVSFGKGSHDGRDFDRMLNGVYEQR